MPRNMKPSRPSLRKSQFSQSCPIFADTQKVPNLIEEEIKSWNSCPTIIEITSII